MRLDGLPPHKQHVLVYTLNATPELMSDVARSGGDDGLSLDEGCLKF